MSSLTVATVADKLKINSNCECLHKRFTNKELQYEFIKINKYINISAEPIEELTIRQKIPKEYLKNCLIYCCNADKVVGYNMEVFPLFWMYGRPLTDFNIKKIKKKYITMNGAPSDTRTGLIQYLKEKNLLKHGYYSLYNGYQPPEYILPSEKNTKHHFEVKYSYPIEWYNSTYDFQIETCNQEGLPFYCITEKTFRPLLSGKPFLNFGFAGMYKLLKSFGFKFNNQLLFDEDVKNRFDLYLNEVAEQMHKEPNMNLVLHNKKIARTLYENNKESHAKFLQQLDNLSNKTYLNRKMVNHLHGEKFEYKKNY
tara:strand:+ start:4445 stop:5377 length:933 start_codon:yes stop_codon:yes gene_type:complete